MSLLSAQDLFRFKEGCGFIKFQVNPDTINQIPTFDVVSLLTVYHHWCREFGWDESEEMLRTLTSGANKLFFEIPDEQIKSSQNSSNDAGSNAEGWRKYLEGVFNDSVEVDHIALLKMEDCNAITP